MFMINIFPFHISLFAFDQIYRIICELLCKIIVEFQVMSEFLPHPPAATFLAFNPVDNNIVAVGKEDAEISIFWHSKVITLEIQET